MYQLSLNLKEIEKGFKKLQLNEILKLKHCTKVLVRCDDEKGKDIWFECTTICKDKDFYLRDDESKGNLTDIDKSILEFCDIYEYNESIAKELITKTRKEKIEEPRDKKFDITIYYTGGTSSTLTKQDEKVVRSLMDWLDGDSKNTYKLELAKCKKTVVIKKENILFLNIVEQD